MLYIYKIFSFIMTLQLFVVYIRDVCLTKSVITFSHLVCVFEQDIQQTVFEDKN